MAPATPRNYASIRQLDGATDASWYAALATEPSDAPSVRAMIAGACVGVLALFLVTARLAVPVAIAVAVVVGIIALPRHGVRTRTFTGEIAFGDVVTFGPAAGMAAMLRIIERFPDQLVFPVVDHGKLLGLVVALDVLAQAARPLTAREIMHPPLVVTIADRGSILALQRSGLPGAPVRGVDGRFQGIIYRGMPARAPRMAARQRRQT